MGTTLHHMRIILVPCGRIFGNLVNVEPIPDHVLNMLALILEDVCRFLELGTLTIYTQPRIFLKWDFFPREAATIVKYRCFGQCWQRQSIITDVLANASRDNR